VIGWLIDASAKNRALVLFAAIALAIGGVTAMRNIKLDAIPDLSDPQVIVFTEWMGRSPTLVEDQVTYPLVTSLLGAPHVVDVRGQTMFGMSFVYVVFEEGTDLYWARSRVLEYLNTVRSRLPPDANTRIGPDATGIGWVYQYALVDRTGRHDLGQLRTLQDFSLRYALTSVPGVAEVASVGGYEQQYQVTVDPVRLRNFGLSVSDVVQAVRRSNNDVGARVLEMSEREYFVRGRGYLTRVEDIENIVIRAERGTPVLVRDVGHVTMGGDIRRGAADFDGLGEAVSGIVVMRYGENALDVIGRVERKLEELRPTLPEGVEVVPVYNRKHLIERAIDTLKSALTEEMIVVALVIILFLLHLRSALLPIIALPLAVVTAFIPMYFLGIPATIMSLGGIAIAIGATVDAEIVMVEAAHKKLEHAPKNLSHAEREKLLAEAAREVTPAIFFSLLIIAVSFLPVFGLTGQAGRLFKPLAYTKTFVMLSAALLSVTVAPALRDYLIRGKIFSEARHPVSRAIRKVYEPFVHVALHNPKTTVLIGVMALVSALPIAQRLGSEFMPPLDEGDLLYMPTTFPNISIEEARQQLRRQDEVLRSFPEVTVGARQDRARRYAHGSSAALDGRDRRSTEAPKRVAHEVRPALVRREHARVHAAAAQLAPARVRAHDPRGSRPRDERATSAARLDERFHAANSKSRRHAHDRHSHADRHQGLRHRPCGDRARWDVDRAHPSRGARHPQRALRALRRWALRRRRPQP
jgi:Cu(I)/Ag(I) efflux system membrane protein CusA/SilA